MKKYHIQKKKEKIMPLIFHSYHWPKNEGQAIKKIVLSGWPLHLPFAKDMDVDVIHRLTAVFTVVDDHPEAIIQTLLLGHFLCHEQKMSEHLFIAVLSMRQANYGFLWHDEEVDGSLGRDVVEHHTLVIFV